MKRALTLSLALIATAASATELAPATRSTRETLGQKTQWAPSGNFQALHGRAVFRSEIRSESRPYARARGEVASGIGIFLSRDSVGASSYLSSPNALGPWSYANLSPARYSDRDGREVSDESKYAEFVGKVFDRELEDLSKEQLLDIVLDDDAIYATDSRARDRLGGGDLPFLRSLACAAIRCRQTGAGLSGWVSWKSTETSELISNSGPWRAATNAAEATAGAYRSGRASLVATGGDVAAPMLDGLNVYASANVTRSDYVSLAPSASRTTTDIARFFGEGSVDLAIGEVEGAMVFGSLSRLAGASKLGKLMKTAENVAAIGETKTFRIGKGLGIPKFKNQNYSALYILKDKVTGQLLKAGKTTAAKMEGRLEKYATASAKTGRTLEVEVVTFRPDDVTTETVEKALRDKLSKLGHELPWDNTNRRLKRPGSGTPGILSSKMRKEGWEWDLEAEKLVPPPPD